MSIEKEKLEKFRTIAQQLYTQEYIGINDYGKDVEYEEQLTDISTDYLVSIFYDPNNTHIIKEQLITILNKKQPQYKSNIISLIVS